MLANNSLLVASSAKRKQDHLGYQDEGSILPSILPRNDTRVPVTSHVITRILPRLAFDEEDVEKKKNLGGHNG